MIARRTSNPQPTSAPRVLIVLENLPLARDHRVRKQCAALLEAGFAVSLICQRDERNGLFPGIDLHEYPPPAPARSKLTFVYEYAYSWAMATMLTIKVFVRSRFDVIQTCNPPDTHFFLAAPFKALGKRVVVDQRDLSPELYRARYGSTKGPLLPLLLLLERLSVRVADHVLCVNDTLAEIAEARGGKPASSITVVRNGPVLARASSRPPRPELKKGRRFLCCWVGVMGPQDRVDLALGAAHHLVHERGRTDCHFVFVGDGDALPSLQELTQQLDLASWVTFTGWLDEQAVFDHIASSDIGLETNQQAEVSPVKAMEYMALGLPVVAFEGREMRFTAGTAAVYAAPDDAAGFATLIADLLDDPERRATMGSTGRARVEELLAWDRQKERYVDLYRHLLGDPPVSSVPEPESSTCSDG